MVQCMERVLLKLSKMCNTSMHARRGYNQLFIQWRLNQKRFWFVCSCKLCKCDESILPTMHFRRIYCNINNIVIGSNDILHTVRKGFIHAILLPVYR